MIKPLLMRHTETLTESFKSWRNTSPYIHNPWHYHPEIEITLILKGHGVLFIGDKIEKYSGGDLFLIGSNLPHEFRSDLRKENDFYSDSIALHFKNKFPGLNFQELFEAEEINGLLNKSVNGIKFRDNSLISLVSENLLCLEKLEGIERISLLISILNAMSTTTNIEMLSSPGFFNSFNYDQSHKINEAYKFIIANFKESISQKTLANKLNMTTSSFSRFFRTRANKSFINFLNEVRVGYSCKLLLEDDLNISEVAYESGFQNISYFNKQFKKITKLTPTEFICMHKLTSENKPPIK